MSNRVVIRRSRSVSIVNSRNPIRVVVGPQGARGVGAFGGASTSTDNAVARFDGTTGVIQNSPVIITDAGDIGIPGQVIAGGNFQIGQGGLGRCITIYAQDDAVGAFLNVFQENAITYGWKFFVDTASGGGFGTGNLILKS